MNEFELTVNDVLIDTFNIILKYEEVSLGKITDVAVTISEAHMIDAIGRQAGKVPVSKIAEHLNITMPTASAAIKKLEHKGLVQKDPCAADGRRALVSLTAEGLRVGEAHWTFHERMVKSITSQLVDSEQDVLLVALGKLNEFFKTKLEA